MSALKVVIVGGVAGGASAAARLRRLSETAEIVMLERGEYVSFANCGLPYHIGGTIRERDRLLLQTPQSLKARFNLDVRTLHEALAIDRAAKTVTVLDHRSGQTYDQPYDRLILSPGAQPIRPPMPGLEHALSLRSLPDMDAIIERLEGASHATVVGGGFIGLEVAENLRERGLEVDLVEAAPQVLGPLDFEMAALVRRELEAHGVRLHLSDAVVAVGGGGRSVTLRSGPTLATDLVVLAIGVRPDTRLARQAGLEIGPRGGIAVSESLQTSDPEIYAVGDAAEKTDLLGQPALIPLAWAANRQGRLAADHILNRPIRFGPSQGTAVVKVFGLTAASTGLNERTLKAQNLPYRAVHIHPASHAAYYPGAQVLSLKLLFDPGSGRIYGAQAVGREGTDKRIDVLATAMRGGLSAFELAALELAYAPPYGSAKDPVNLLGYVAENLGEGLPTAQWDEVDGQTLLLDVRDPEEYARGHLRGAINLPLNDLRGRWKQLPDRSIVVYCQVGLRGYLAQRLLRQRGLEASNLDGGFATISAARPELVEEGELTPA